MSSDQLKTITESFPDLLSTCGLQSEYERWWLKWHEDNDVGQTISNFVDSLHCADNDLYPNVTMILFISAIRPSTTAGNERRFSTLKRFDSQIHFLNVQIKSPSIKSGGLSQIFFDENILIC